MKEEQIPHLTAMHGIADSKYWWLSVYARSIEIAVIRAIRVWITSITPEGLLACVHAEST